MRPDDETKQVFLYCLAEAAQRFGIEIVGFLAMSNHYHAVVHDPGGRLPDFACHFHQMLAKVLNVRWSRWENLWSTEPPTYTLLADPSDVFDKLLYVLLNPVADHIVDSVNDWPGASSWRLRPGKAMTVKRPRHFFRANGAMPEHVVLRVEVPKHVEMSADDWDSRVREAVQRRERAIREKRLAAGKRVLGRRAALSAAAFDTPVTTAPRRKLRPFVACKNESLRLAMLDALQRFHEAYREARQRFIDGVRNVLFPAGTFALRRLGVACAPL